LLAVEINFLENRTSFIGWKDLMVQSGADHMELQAAFAKFKGMTPMTWIRKRRLEVGIKPRDLDSISSLHRFLTK